MRRIQVFLLVVTMTCLASTVYAIAHPADDYQPRELQPGFGTEELGLGPECNINELYFVRPLPEPESLTRRERYILAGADNTPWGTMRPWYSEIQSAVSAYYENTGTMPREISASLLEANAGACEVPADWLEIFKSPINGRFPVLDAREFSAGDLYIRALTDEEMRYIADKVPQFDEIWFAGLMYEPQINQFKHVKLLNKPLYVRVYGEQQVIHTGIFFNWTLL